LPVDSSASIVTAGILGDRYVSLQLGGEEQVLKSGDTMTFTESAVILESLIGKFMYGRTGGNGGETIRFTESGKEHAINAGGESNLLVYVGHDGLMDFSLSAFPKQKDNRAREAVILACASKYYFTKPLKETGATPYDIKGAEFGHVGDHCSFDAVMRLFEIKDPALDHLSMIVRGADTSRPDLTPQCEGLLAISYGLSANFPDDHEMLGHGLVIYDALYRWCRLQEERHRSAAKATA